VKTKGFLLFGTIVSGLALIVKAARISLTPEFWDWLVNAGVALLRSDTVGFLFVGTAILFLLSLCAAAWERAERKCAAKTLAAAHLVETYRPRKTESPLLWTPTPGQDLTKVLFPGAPCADSSSLLDDSPGPLPETFRAPCGEPIRFPSTNDSGPKAA